MRVLCACEESQAVCIAFRERGHEAYSCDILPCSGGHPEWHIEGDVGNVISQSWDMMIAFPPCTDLCVSGARWFKNKQFQQQAAIRFFEMLATSDVPKIALENPVGIISTVYRKPDQIINPWQFGHKEMKKHVYGSNIYPHLHLLILSDHRRPKKTPSVNYGKSVSVWRGPKTVPCYALKHIMVSQTQWHHNGEDS